MPPGHDRQVDEESRHSDLTVYYVTVLLHCEGYLLFEWRTKVLAADQTNVLDASRRIL